MRLFLALILMFVQVSMVLGQSNCFFIRTYNYSLAVLFDTNYVSSFYLYSDYGKTKQLSRVEVRYLYHGQEINRDLDLYFFPSRTYSINKNSFQQVDPESQFYSSYLFLGVDPINHIDENGNVSKPLVLYQEEHDFPNSMNPGTADLIETTDAYHVPMSDLVLDKIPNLPEWNGNVFLKGHLGHSKAGEVLLEASRDKSLLKSGAVIGVKKPFYHPYFSSNLSVYNGKQMGRTLRRLSDKTGVQIKRVIAGGCEGGYAMESIQYGFTEESKLIGKAGLKAKFYGLKDGNYVKYMGRNTYKSFKYDIFPSKMRYYLTPKKGERVMPFVDRSDGKRIFRGFKTRVGLSFKKDPYIEGREVNDFVNGRIPRKFKSAFRKFTVMY